MNKILEAIIYFDELTADEQKALSEMLSERPELLQVFDYWQQLRKELNTSLNASLPERDVLVLYALNQHQESLLSQAEKHTLSESIDSIELALTKHPSLSYVVDNIKNAQSDFLETWDSFTSSSSSSRTKIFSLSPATILRVPAVRIAATFLILALSFYSIFTLWDYVGTETIKVEENGFKTVHFDDGSEVRLVGASELSFSKPILLSSFDRFVKIDGNAYFDIAPSVQPFKVETSTALTEATGTQFSISSTAEHTEVVLANGQVTVSSRNISAPGVTLSPGQVSRVPRNEPPSTPEQLPNITDHLSWTNLLIFHFSPLETVVHHLSSHFDVLIQVSPTLAREPFKATFDPDTLSLDEALETLSFAFNAQVDSLSIDDVYMLTSVSP